MFINEFSQGWWFSDPFYRQVDPTQYVYLKFSNWSGTNPTYHDLLLLLDGGYLDQEGLMVKQISKYVFCSCSLSFSFSFFFFKEEKKYFLDTYNENI